jgi:membrane protease YdiL (CAAX protease family)
MVVYAFFPVAVFEEAFGRGYVLDRLVPQHPCGLKKALPAIVLSSILFSVYHLPAYFLVYSLSRPWAIVLLVANVFPNAVFLSISYVRSRTRNVGGPVLVHFLMDGLPYVLLLI